MTVLLRSALSLEFIRVPVSTVDEDGAAVDVTGDDVALAFVEDGAELEDDTPFIPATWETNDADPANPIYYARLLVGPGGDYEPAAGTRRDVWVQITDNPEEPRIRAGGIRFE